MPEVSIRELSVQDDGDGTHLKIEPLHLVFETGDSDPTCASSPVPTPTRFQAKAFVSAFDPTDMVRAPSKNGQPNYDSNTGCMIEATTMRLLASQKQMVSVFVPPIMLHRHQCCYL